MDEATMEQNAANYAAREQAARDHIAELVEAGEYYVNRTTAGTLWNAIIVQDVNTLYAVVVNKEEPTFTIETDDYFKVTLPVPTDDGNPAVLQEYLKAQDRRAAIIVEIHRDPEGAIGGRGNNLNV